MTKGKLPILTPDISLAFDASALINIAASGYCAEFVSSLGRPCFAEEIVWREVAKYTERYRLNENIEKAVACGLVDIVDMSQLEAVTYLSLIAAPHPNGLDDGEAATIAVAHSRRAVAIIDEKKGRRIASELIPPLPVLSTMDLFRMIERESLANG